MISHSIQIRSFYKSGCDSAHILLINGIYIMEKDVSRGSLIFLSFIIFNSVLKTYLLSIFSRMFIEKIFQFL